MLKISIQYKYKYSNVKYGGEKLLYSKLKKEALSELKKNVDIYQNTYENTVIQVMNLHDKRITYANIISNVEEFVNALANRPKEFDKLYDEININRTYFQREVKEIEVESRKAEIVNRGVAGAGAAAGVGVVAFGPTLAMAVATTFGTASTGTAIATLSGAAATNAALAWLGGGALAIGGGGMAAGEAFLALAGPVGWAIGAAALVGSGTLTARKNKKISEKAEREAIKVLIEIGKLKRLKAKVAHIILQSDNLSNCISTQLKKVIDYNISDYKNYTEEQLGEVIILLNTTLSLSKKIREKVE